MPAANRMNWVAPHAGAWIETQTFGQLSDGTQVAPHAGAWIETDRCITPRLSSASPLTQGRGLKLPYSPPRIDERMSPLTQGRGLKRVLREISPSRWSRPSRRGVD